MAPPPAPAAANATGINATAAKSSGGGVAAANAAAQGGTRKLKKGELLFAEGENSRAMYLLKTGVLRIFKKKGDSFIEIDTVRQGSVIGELAFLDGNPRSASAEALAECEVVEVSGPMFQEVLSKIPDWVKILLKTVVGRLRAASTRIRQLETASTAFDYSDKDGKRSAHYVYLSPTDVLKIATAALLVGSRAEGGAIRMPVVQRYANHIMGVPAAKITSIIDILGHVGIVHLDPETPGQTASGDCHLIDAPFLERAISYLNEENLLEPSKRHDITLRSFFIMSLISKHLGDVKKDPATGVGEINLAAVRKAETPASGKEPFRMDELGELIKVGYLSNLNIKNNDEVISTLKVESFQQAYRIQRVSKMVDAANEQKRKG